MADESTIIGTQPKGMIKVEARNITTNTETYWVDAQTINQNAGVGFQQKSGRGYTISNDDHVQRKYPQKIVPQASATQKPVPLPMLIGYSWGYDNDHKFALPNDNVKNEALFKNEDSKSSTNETLTNPDLDPMDGISEIQAIDNMRSLVNAQTSTKNGTYSVGDQIIDFFVDNKGNAIEFTSSILNSVVEEDSNFNFFKRGVAYKILIKLKMMNWDISKITQDKLVRFKNVAFNSDENHSDGLTILMDTVEHIEVYIQEYTPPDELGNFHMKLKFVLFDRFGLDKEDLEKYGKRKSNAGWWRTAGAALNVTRIGTDWGSNVGHVHVEQAYGYSFTSWWILQHRFNHKPPITKVTVFQEGQFNKFTTYRSPKNASLNTDNDFQYDRW